jgi:hypothetical protein
MMMMMMMMMMIKINMAIPEDRYVTQKEAENKLKHKSLCTEIKRMWNMKYMINTSGNWSHRNWDKRFREIFESHARKTFNRFTTKDSCTWNITRNTESTAV